MMRFAYLLAVAFACVAVGALPVQGWAMQPPEPGMLEQLAAEGNLDSALEFAESLGNHSLKAPLRGIALGTDSPQSIADLIASHFGQAINDRTTAAIASSTPQDRAWLELDLNHDNIVDERDVLALGQPQPKTTALFPSLGTVKTFALIIEFPDYPSYFDASEFDENLFGAGDDFYYYKSLQYYYGQASYGQMTIEGDVFGWYTADHDRTYYHPDDNEDYPWDSDRRREMIREALLDADANGADFSEYDNDGDGGVDYFLVIYTGPQGAWATFWWGYYGVSVGSDFSLDGVIFPAYSLQWERRYNIGATPPALARWDPKVTIHETGHSLGLPDYYDYDGNQGPDGGVGSLDMMHGNWGDHNCFSKYALGWLNPLVAFTNLDDQPLDKSSANGDALIFMPGFDPVSPWSEYFMAQNRHKSGIDSTYPTSGMLLWHVDARVGADGKYEWNNSYTSHKLLRLMEADGLEEIENNGSADSGDYYSTGQALSPTSTPNSDKYDATNPGITCDDFSAAGDTMTLDVTMFTSNPPTVSIDVPSAGAGISGDQTVTITASDDNAVSNVQLLIDGVLVEEWGSGPYTYTWNSLVEFNGAIVLEARAWDAEDQAGIDSISVTVSNTGVTSFSDDFESGLVSWREIHSPTDPNSTYIGSVAQLGSGKDTQWSTRTSPASPTPLGTGNEAYVVSANGGVNYKAMEHLRTERIDATGFTNPVQVMFDYRTTGNASLWVTTDQGSTYEKLYDLPATDDWRVYRGVFPALVGESVYFQLFYSDTFKGNDDAGLSLNLDDLLIQEAPSAAPTVSFSSHVDNDEVAGTELFEASAADDGTVTEVQFFVAGSLVATDTSVPFEYTRDTTDDDNHPGILIAAIAVDDDDLVSIPAEISVNFNNDRPYPNFDDLESGTDNWTVDNDSDQPDWVEIDNGATAYSGTHCWGWVGAVTDNGNSDRLGYRGYAPAEGRKSINLAHADANLPVLRFKYNADVPSDCGLRVRTYSTWNGWKDLGWVNDYASGGWADAEFDLSAYQGQSIRIYLYLINSSLNGGTGFWLDDIRIENALPTISSIVPARATVGTEITINGIGFGLAQGSSSVSFGGGIDASAGELISWKNNKIVVEIPADAISGDVTVTVGSETSAGYVLTVVLGPPTIGGLEQL